MSSLGDRLIEAVRVKPNDAAMRELRRQFEAMHGSAVTYSERTAVGALKWLIEMYDRIRAAEKQP